MPTKKKNDAAKLTCSWCHASNHALQTCPYRRTSNLPYVPVKNHPSKIISPHVVELPGAKTAGWSKKITAYQEKTVKKDRPIVADLAAIVRAANVDQTNHRAKIAALKEVAIDEAPSLEKVEIQIEGDVEITPTRGWEIVRDIPAETISVEIVEEASPPITSATPVPVQITITWGERWAEFQTAFSVRKFATTAVVFSLLAALPFPAVGYYQKLKVDANTIIEESTNAFLALQSSTVAVLNTNIPQAEHDLNAALNAFGQAQQLLEKDHRALVYVGSLLPIIGPQVRSRQHLLTAGQHIALGNTYLVKGVDEATTDDARYMVDRLATLRVHMRGAIPQYETALKELGQVEPNNLPIEYQQSFTDFKKLFTAFVKDLRALSSVMSGLETMLGNKDFKRYLVLFQNNHELRPTGGFVGSYAVLDIQKGKIQKLDIPGGGSYDVQGQLDTYLKPPVPLQLINSRWEFQDGNWFPDFPASAKKMAWFYQHSRGTTVDGVIAVNASVLERVLKVLGPVYSEKYQVAVAAENKLNTLQNYVENGYDKKTNQPKAVLSDVLAGLITSVRDTKPQELLSLVTELNSALQEKEIQVYMNDPSVQAAWHDFGWTGEIAKSAPAQDYLMIVNTNLGGGKSDARVKQLIEHEAAVQADGSVVDTVFIKRTHTGAPGEKYYGDDNVNYVRVYVPEGAELLDAGGFVYPAEESFLAPEDWYKTDPDLTAREVEKSVHVGSGTRVTGEFGKTAFGNWAVTKAGETSEAWFRYKLPFKVLGKDAAPRYSLLWQKQSGTAPTVNMQVIFPEGWRPIWRTAETIDLRANGATYSGILDTDTVLGVVMKHI